MSAPRIHRTTSNCKAGRKLAAQTTRIDKGPTPEQQAWNARIDAERKAKKEKNRGWQPFKLALPK